MKEKPRRVSFSDGRSLVQGTHADLSTILKKGTIIKSRGKLPKPKLLNSDENNLELDWSSVQ